MHVFTSVAGGLYISQNTIFHLPASSFLSPHVICITLWTNKSQTTLEVLLYVCLIVAVKF